MSVRVVDSFGNAYVLGNPEVVADSFLGPCLTGQYREEGEFFSLGDGSFRLETCQSWESVDFEDWGPPEGVR